MPKGRKNSQSLQGNAEQKGSKSQKVFQGHEWTRKWQMSFGRGKQRELHSEKIIQTGLTRGLLGASSEAPAKSWVGVGYAEDTELPHAPLQGREQKLLAIFGKNINHKVENKSETRIKPLPYKGEK